MTVRKIVIGSIFGVVGGLVSLFALYAYLADEIDTKFRESIDAVPTRVYSRMQWIETGGVIALEDLEQRLRERDYRQAGGVDPGLMKPGQYSIGEEDSDGWRHFHIALRDPELPPVANEFFLSDPQVARAGLIEMLWRQGAVGEIRGEGDKEYRAFGLDPILVAQLSASNIEARRNVPLADIPHTLLKAIVLTEDQRFLEHVGFDPRGLARSMWANLRAGRYVQGGGTITMQLIRNVHLTRRKSIVRKMKEIVMAVMLEFRFSKDEILEKYLNEVYFGQSGNIAIHGVSEAARFYFDKSLNELSVSEQAMLAGLVRGPFFYSPFKHPERAKQRQELVLQNMRDHGVITEREYGRAIRENIRVVKAAAVQDRAPYFSDLVKNFLIRHGLTEEEILGGGLKVFSTLDPRLQKFADTAVEQGVDRLEKELRTRLAKKKSEDQTRMLQGAFLSVDPRTGHILAAVGGRSYEESNYNRLLLMKREVGSTMKPFVYLAALINGKDESGDRYNSISKFEDKPFTWKYDDKEWTPKNYEPEFEGTVTLRRALAASINTVAAQVAARVGPQKVVDAAVSAGVETKLDPLPSLALGAVALGPIEVAAAYTTLSNWGLRKTLTPVLLVVDSEGKEVVRFSPEEKQALPAPETVNLVDIMRSVFIEGSGRFAKDWGWTRPAAGKTGTTNDFRDSWFVGFSPRLLALSWVGFDKDDELVMKHRKLLKLTGAVGALPVWIEFMKAAHAGLPVEDFQYPDGAVRRLKADLVSGGVAGPRCTGPAVVDEVFTDDNIPRRECGD